jgi:type I restriction enzyme R subunit
VVLAHIVAVGTGGESTADNLIALCANCHARADLDNWGESTLRSYKDRPWILRKKEADEHEESEKRTVKVTLSLESPTLDETQQERLIRAIAQFLGTKDSDIKILRVEQG